MPQDWKPDSRHNSWFDSLINKGEESYVEYDNDPLLWSQFKKNAVSYFLTVNPLRFLFNLF